MDYEQMTAPCGLDCFNCQFYLANDNQEIRSELAKKLRVPEEKLLCRGCREGKGAPDIFKLMDKSDPCKAYKCAEEKNIRFCHECSDFPCDHLHPYADKAGMVPHNTKVFNLCLIKKMGLEAWAEEKAGKVKDTYFNGEWKL